MKPTYEELEQKCALQQSKLTAINELMGVVEKASDIAKAGIEELELQLEESQREFRAADATIHNLELQLTEMAVQLANSESKCRELAAENDRAFKAVTVFSNVTHDITEIICDELGQERVAEIVAAYNDLSNMPATGACLAEVRAQGVDYAIGVIEDCANNLSPGGTGEAVQYAQEMVNPYLDSIHDKLADKSTQLRKGGAA